MTGPLVLLALLTGLVGMYPFTLYIWSLRLLPPRPIRRGAELSPDTPLTLCFCAYNEERVLPQKLANIRALKQRYPGLRVLAYVDASTDRTLEILEAAGDLVETTAGAERHGKSYGMNLLVQRATSDLVLFTDANVMVDEAAPGRITGYFADPEVGCVCGYLVYVDSRTGAAKTNSLLWQIEERTKAAESAVGSVMGADGSLFAIRRALHRPVPPDIIDDMFLSFSILCDGYRIVSARDVLAHEESVASPAEEYRRKIRIACQAFNVHRLIWPRLRKLGPVTVYKYLTHRFLRWMCPFALLLSGLLLVAALMTVLPPLLVVLMVGAGSAAVAWLGTRDVWPFGLVWSVLLSLAGVGVGVLRSLWGERFQTWQPAASVRASGNPSRDRA